MSAPIEAWVETQYRSSDPRGESQRKFVLYMIARSASPQGWAIVSVPALARQVSQNERTVRRHLAQLDKREGVLSRMAQGEGPNGSRASLFRVMASGVDARAEPPVMGRSRAPTAQQSTIGCIHTSPPCDDCSQKKSA